MSERFIDRNDRSRARLRELLEGADEEALRRRVDATWTVSALLAHLAFWDRWAEARWRVYAVDGCVDSIPDGTVDLVNEASLPQWIALSPRKAARLAMEAAESIDQRIAYLPPDAVDYARSTGREAMLDRSIHRTAHLDEIARALAG